MIDPLYQKRILRLAAEAHGAGRIAGAGFSATVRNPMCGDQIRVDIDAANGRIAALAHETRACVLCQASASLLAQTAPGHGREAISLLRDDLQTMLAGGDASGTLGEYAVFTPVRDHPNRHNCVILPLDAVLEALRCETNESDPAKAAVTT
ncbi:MAG: iron-sulfur cluster assembly scaffold protein [Sphingomonadales bacterium]